MSHPFVRDAAAQLRETYSAYCRNSGAHRKYLMRQTATNAAVVYDYFSLLEVRLEQLLRCPELTSASSAVVTELLARANLFKVECQKIASDLVKTRAGDALNKTFGDVYDVAASIVEGFESAASRHLETLSSLSEDAQIIRRRTHTDKDPIRDKQKSLAAKAAWRAHRGTMMQGIKTFHKSTTGKQFHRNLARYNNNRTESFTFTEDDVLVTAKGLSSLQTHLLIEIENTYINSAQKGAGVEQYTTELREMFHVFNEALVALVDARFTGDKEAVANVLDIISDFYSIGEYNAAA